MLTIAEKVRKVQSTYKPKAYCYDYALDSIVVVYVQFAICISGPTVSEIDKAHQLPRFTGIDFYKSICDARPVAKFEKCRLKHPEKRMQVVMLNCNASADSPYYWSIAYKYYKMFAHRDGSIFYDEVGKLFWFTDADCQPYACVCAIKASKETYTCTGCANK